MDDAAEVVHLPVLQPQVQPPQIRGDCLPGGLNEARPCPWATCRHHLAHPEQSCVLDLVAERGPLTLEEVAEFFGLTRERIRQIEFDVLRKLRKSGRVLYDWRYD